MEICRRMLIAAPIMPTPRVHYTVVPIVLLAPERTRDDDPSEPHRHSPAPSSSDE